ncbi:histidine kinase dimerization/phosphoacceptor domain -containing protein [Povalibacter sp.]|uniref:histidine kinase dimerization/phosphoacceptor domain -containing protein n=1 Tax=Povalibacter sp. TaxID=1962978 RepID=UPI002F424FC2
MSAEINGETGIQPGDLRTSRALLRAPSKQPDLPAQLAAFCELSVALVDDPRAAIRRSLEIAIRLCGAGSAGLSILSSNDSGHETVRWEMVSGALAPHEGIETPRDLSPCGLCLDANETVLIGQPEQAFCGLRDTLPAIVEDLIVPLHDHTDKTIGTLWVASHDATSHFSRDDASILERVATQVRLALTLQEKSRDAVYALALVQSHQLAHQKLLALDLAEERRLRERAEASDREARQLLMFSNTALIEVNHRVKNTLQIAASLLSMHGRATTSVEARDALRESFGRLHLLAKVHEMLYVGDDGVQEILISKLLHSMGDALQGVFSDLSGRVGLQITADPIVLSPDDAIPIALLVNEVVTNAYKHAFPEGSAGMIRVNFSCVAESVMLLRIMDDGIGMGLAGRTGSLGLKLVQSLADQLQASLAFEKPSHSGGTVVTLRIHRATPGADMAGTVKAVRDATST